MVSIKSLLTVLFISAVSAEKIACTCLDTTATQAVCPLVKNKSGAMDTATGKCDIGLDSWYNFRDLCNEHYPNQVVACSQKSPVGDSQPGDAPRNAGRRSRKLKY
ncbi:uncharacterized protein L3040_001489 [Drepanopeziza brunnea f. sp. 'multigermtubi']|uniref:Uncharacterized protein n=1 Tax=Marssonina brunnea f. sp. multigermtubi (strain MB_m1) TaxID=1072389 RepID=K1WGR2_MARBU|nr:uncharacterized protein MBM_05219 [Drepanopeziza brunnea f. sp. 'multigermtubi' MB_m1]EKD16750.1 hypothetical protein MBM_05219 [Drepanopeziza brunnea f. sp. 'multigermtubi' MB_m1]KAJ5051716.1 hypothetical protein L3040_001489 [Drepanopeziza brunnea f. sp. 'multigermtubi']